VQKPGNSSEGSSMKSDTVKGYVSQA
jgi:hypothetical protein